MQDRPPLKIRRRNLPHWERDGAMYFITFNTWERLELTPPARQIVMDACRFFENQRYRIDVGVVMPDHVHLLMQPLPKSETEFWSLSQILHSIKSFSAKQIPIVMPHIGTIWQPETCDRIIRDQHEFHTVYNYIANNPIKAGLTPSSTHYPFFWRNPLSDDEQARRLSYTTWQSLRQNQ